MNLKKELGLLDLFCIATGAMISSGLFILPGLAFSKTGPAVILSYFLSGMLIVPTMLSKAELGTAMPKAGGNYFFIDRSMGPQMGALGGLTDWISSSLKGAFALFGIGLFVSALNPQMTEMHVRLLMIVCCLFFTTVNVIGVGLTGRVQIAMAVGLLFLLVFYVVIGAFSIQVHRYTPFMPYGIGPVLRTAGLIFVAYLGLTKIVDIAEEVKNPGRNLPLAMILSWITVGILYVLVIFVTVGTVDAARLQDSTTPITLGAHMFMGFFGVISMGIAAILAFATTANAGILVASRTPLAMSRDKLLPGSLERISTRGTPVSAIIFTSAFMILVLLFLNLESLAKAASTMTFLLFIFVNLSLIFMRESKIKSYNPPFKCPLYPWIQIAGITSYMFLIIDLGIIPLLIVCAFICCGLGWYWIYTRGKVTREYALMHVANRITGVKSTMCLLEEELEKIAQEM